MFASRWQDKLFWIPIFMGMTFLTLFQTRSWLVSTEVFQEIIIKEGDTLWSIANHYLRDPKRWPEILKHNNLPVTDPTAALPGMKLKLPVLLIKEELRKANLVWLLNDVRYRKKDQAAWKKALRDMELYNEDGLRTMEKSQARVKFYSGELLNLDENSLAILRPELKQEEVNLLSGALRASKAKVITPTAEITPQSKGTIYKARVRDDKATIIQVEKGSAEVLGLDTKHKVILQAGFANITLPMLPPSVPVKAPNLPEFKTPEFSPEGKLLIPENLTWPSVAEGANKPRRIEIEPPSPVEYEMEQAKKLGKKIDPQVTPDAKVRMWKAYRIVVARDSKFSELVWQEQKEWGGRQRIATDVKDYHLPDGIYYRGISYLDESGKETEMRNLGSFEIDTVPPKITIFSPAEGHQSKEPLVTIEGQTEPKCFVLINNFTVSVSPEGNFSFPVILAKPGANKIKIWSHDPAGNRSQTERIIYLVGGR